MPPFIAPFLARRAARSLGNRALRSALNVRYDQSGDRIESVGFRVGKAEFTVEPPDRADSLGDLPL